MSKKPSVQAEFMFIGEEPIFGSKGEMSFIRSLNWYSNIKDAKDSKKYVLEYLKHNKYDKKILEKVSSINDDTFTNLGFILRMKERGAVLTEAQNNIIENKLSFILNYEKSKEVSSPTQPITLEKKETTIQDRVFDQATQYINEIEGHIDEFIKTKQSKFKCYDWLASSSIKSIYISHIKDHYTPLYNEISATINKEDDQLQESYSHWSKKELTKYLDFVSNILKDCDNYSNNTKTVKKTRKKKLVPANKKVLKLNYKKEDIQYKLVSINPADIIGASRLWVFNTKTKKLGLYISKDESGFSVKGTTIEGFDEALSLQKTLRKPEESLKSVLDKKISNKKAQKEFWESIKTTENALTGRLNLDTILVKVLK
jgi:hypothetical protein